jgi:hypothetical protein
VYRKVGFSAPGNLEFLSPISYNFNPNGVRGIAFPVRYILPLSRECGLSVLPILF